MKHKKLIFSVIALTFIIIVTYVIFFLGVVTDTLMDNGEYRTCSHILKVNYIITKDTNTLNQLCNVLYLISENNSEEDLETTYKYYTEMYNSKKPVDNLFYTEYLKIIAKRNDFETYQKVCKAFLDNWNGETIHIAESLELVYSNGNQEQKKWVESIINNILTNISTNTPEEYKVITEYYNSVIEES